MNGLTTPHPWRRNPRRRRVRSALTWPWQRHPHPCSRRCRKVKVRKIYLQDFCLTSSYMGILAWQIGEQWYHKFKKKRKKKKLLLYFSKNYIAQVSVNSNFSRELQICDYFLTKIWLPYVIWFYFNSTVSSAGSTTQKSETKNTSQVETKTLTRSASQKVLTNQKSEGEKDDTPEDVLGKWLSGIFPYVKSLYLQVNLLHVYHLICVIFLIYWLKFSQIILNWIYLLLLTRVCSLRKKVCNHGPKTNFEIGRKLLNSFFSSYMYIFLLWT